MEPFYFIHVGGRALVFASNYETMEGAVLAVADAKRLFGRVELRDQSPLDLFLPKAEHDNDSPHAAREDR